MTQGSGLNSVLQHPATYQAALSLAARAQQFCNEAAEALIMIFVGMVAPDGINVNSSQALLRSSLLPFDHALICMSTPSPDYVVDTLDCLLPALFR